jgi:NADH:ubiquinone oxidoreductase subunit F (NADH-binding)
VTVTDDRPATRRLLATWGVLGTRADLAGHRAVHGDLNVRADGGLLDAIARSGLTGRGGGGFPTAAKLELFRRHRPSILAVNASEGEPASRKDATLLSICPHLVLEGAQLAAGLAGSGAVCVCLHEGSAAYDSVAEAIAERRATHLGDLPTEIVVVPSRYISGEESALTNFLMTGRPLPLHRRSKSVPVTFGRSGTVLVQNTETLAHLSLIARHGPVWFQSAGTGGEPGTRLVTISGAVHHPGVYEASAGAPLGSVLGLAGLAAPLSGVLVGGFGGSFVSPQHLALPYSPSGLAPAGAHPGAGVLIALPVGSCPLAEVARVARYMASESAGQCGPCVFGLPAIASDLELLAAGSAGQAVLDRLRSRLGAVAGRGGCRHPDGVVRMVRSALDVFAADLGAHVNGGGCGGRVGVIPVPRNQP